MAVKRGLSCAAHAAMCFRVDAAAQLDILPISAYSRPILKLPRSSGVLRLNGTRKSLGKYCNKKQLNIVPAFQTSS